jgi:predicted Zn-dependent protease with MMP-like domain
MVSAHLEGNVLAGRPPRQNWGKFNAHKWGGFNARSHRVEDFPTDEVLDELKAETEFDLLGLFQGIGLPFQSESAPVHMPNMIWLYRVPILLYWAEHDETLGAIVTHVLVHEIGHHFGLSDADMEAIEASVE